MDIRLKLALLIVGATVVYLIGNASVPLWDRDEPRYAQTSRQMLQSGDWIVPRFLDRVRTAKPIFIYWCQAASMKVFGDTDYAARFPSVVAMTSLLIILSVVGVKTIGPTRTFWTVCIFATSVLTITMAKFSTTDSVLLLWITIAQICLYAIWRGNRSWGIAMTMWAAIGMAILTKGPVIFGVQGTTILVLGILNHFERRRDPSVRPWAWLLGTKPIMGIILAGLIVAPWLYLIKQNAPKFLETTMRHDVWTRILKPLEGHAGPPGYHFVTLWGTFLPWSLFLPIAMIGAWKNRRLPATRFALAAVIGPWVMMEIVQTKLPHYMLPVFPPLAFLAADALVRAIRGQHRGLTSTGALVGITIWAAILAAGSFAAWAALKDFPDTPQHAIVAANLIVLIMVGAVYRRFLYRQVESAAMTMAIGAMACVIVIYGYFLPRAEFLQTAKKTGADLISLGVTDVDEARMLDYMEPSLAFYQGGTIREAGKIGFHMKFFDEMPRWLVITKDLWDKASPDLKDRFEIVKTHRGWAYADDNRIVEVMIVRKK